MFSLRHAGHLNQLLISQFGSTLHDVEWKANKVDTNHTDGIHEANAWISKNKSGKEQSQQSLLVCSDRKESLARRKSKDL